MRARTRDRREAGFTLMEILVAVAILAILSAALTPLVIKYVNDGRRARALSDSQTLGQAILAFHLDTGTWPVNGDRNPNDEGELSRLVGLPGGQRNGIPGGDGTGGSNNWDGGGDGGASGAIEDHLIRNRTRRVNPLYPVSETAPGPPGWNGPYLKTVPLDPWGRPYVCNVRYLEGANVRGVSDAEEEDHAVFCLSAGANGVFETFFEDRRELRAPRGDDIGWPIQSDSTL